MSESFKDIDGKDLLNIGIKQGPIIGGLLLKAKELTKQGLSKQAILEDLKESYSQRLQTEEISLRTTPLRVSQAIKPKSEEEEINLSMSVAKMEELTLCPIVEAASLMPDACPSGMEFGSIPVGGAIQTNNHIIPAAHSSDLCCSMMATIFKSDQTIKNIMDVMQQATHFGPGGRKNDQESYHPVLEEAVWNNPFLKGLEQIAHKHLQTQGDGNHFFYLGTISNLPMLARELDKHGHYDYSRNLHDSKLENAMVLVTHHGSRNLGAQIYKRGVEQALKETKRLIPNIPKNLAWIDLKTKTGQDYWEAIEYAQRWTIANHNLIHEQTLSSIGTPPITCFKNAHNFVWKHNNKILHGKGATPAWHTDSGQKSIGIIPLNMASEILITLGSDNKNFLSFSPHGAGRNRSRSKTLEKYRDPKTKEIDIKMLNSDFKLSTMGLDIRWASKKLDISESPIGYKSKEDIKAQLQEFGLAQIISEINPKGCIMAGEFPSPWKEKKRVEKLKEMGVEYI
jgi:tRNA-splicing ligase RtcB